MKRNNLKPLAKCAPEKDEQAAFAAWLRINEYIFAYQPNDMPLSSPSGRTNFGWLASAKKRGLIPGMPDYLVFGNARGRCLNIAVEMKRVNGGIASLAQRQTLNRLASVGWKVSICHGAQAAMEFVRLSEKEKCNEL
jgi:hypothetical protein